MTTPPPTAPTTGADAATDQPHTSEPAMTQTPDLTDHLAAIREVGWIAREARTMVAERVPQDSPRWWAYMERKRALLAHIEAERTGSVES